MSTLILHQILTHLFIPSSSIMINTLEYFSSYKIDSVCVSVQIPICLCTHLHTLIYLRLCHVLIHALCVSNSVPLMEVSPH